MTATAHAPQNSNHADRFAIIIPVYNHGKTIADVARGCLEWDLPVYIVDDGSTDDTYANIKTVEGVRLLRHDHNKGKGAALIYGMTEAAGVADWAICLDADGQHDPQEIDVFMFAAEHGGRNIVIGKRSGMQQATWTSRFGRKFSNFWVRASGGPAISDSQSGFRMYPLPEVLHLETRARRYQYEVEVLAKANWAGISTTEVPIRATYSLHIPRISHFKPWQDFWRNAGTFSRLIWRRIFSPKLWFNSG